MFDPLDRDDMDVYTDTLGSILSLGGAKEVGSTEPLHL